MNERKKERKEERKENQKGNKTKKVNDAGLPILDSGVVVSSN
jgi:hypothetical protein